jgi:hypothetical protein
MLPATTAEVEPAHPGGPQVPVLMLTARDDETDILVGLGWRRRLQDEALLDARTGGAHQGAAARMERAKRRVEAEYG